MRKFRRKSPVNKDAVGVKLPTSDSERRDSGDQEGGTERPSGWDLKLSARLSYLGCMRIPEAKSLQRLYEITKQLKQRERQEKRSKQVVFELHALHIVVVDAVSSAPDLNIPLVCISMCANDKAKAVANCFAITATASPGVHECHVFQCQSSKEVENIVQNVALAFKLLGRTRKFSDPGPNSSPAPSPLLPGASMMRIAEVSVSHHPPASPRQSSGATSLSSYFSSSSGNVNRLSDQSSLLELETRSVSINADLDVVSLVPPIEDGTEEELHIRVDKLVADRERLHIVCKAGDPSVFSNETPGFVSALFDIGKNDVDELKRLLDGGLSEHDCDAQGRTLLHYAAACANEDAVRVLLERNANVDAGDIDEATPLHMAAAAGDRETVQLLINSGANVHVTDTAYRSPLHFCACMCGPDSAQMGDFVQCCYVLLESGAQIDLNDLNGMKPVDVFKDLSEMRTRLIESACDGLSSMTEVRLSVWSDDELTGTITPVADFESNLSTAVSTLDRGGNKRLSTDSFGTFLSTSSANTLKRSPTEGGSLGVPTPGNLSRPLSVLSESDGVYQERPVLSDLHSARVALKPFSSMSLPPSFRNRPPSTSSAPLYSTTDLTDGFDQEAKAAFRELDSVVSQSMSNLHIDDKDEEQRGQAVHFLLDHEDVRQELIDSNGEIESYATPMSSTPDVTLCNTRTASEDDLRVVEARSAPTSRTSSLERDSCGLGKIGALRPVSMLSSATNNSSPSSEATVTPESSTWNTLDSVYRTRGRDSQLVRIRNGQPEEDGSGINVGVGGGRNGILRRDPERVDDNDSNSNINRMSITSWTSESSYRQLSPSQRLSLLSASTSPEMSASSTLDSTFRSRKRSDPLSNGRSRVRPGHGETPVTGTLHSSKSLPRISESSTHPPTTDSVSPTVGNPNSVPGSECSSTMTSSFNTLDSSYRGNRSRLTSDTSLQRRLHKASKSLQRIHRSCSASAGENTVPEGAPRRSLSVSGDEVSLSKLSLGLSSLRLLMTLSSNRECHGAILSHLCLAKNSADLVRLARMPVLGDHARDCIATLIHRLFEVEGSVSRQRAVNAGLFSVVLDLLDASDPVRSTCLSISDTILQGDQDVDYMAAVSSVEPDSLLRLIDPALGPYSSQSPEEAKLAPHMSSHDPQGKARSVALRFLSVVSGYGKFRRKMISDRAIRCLKAVIQGSVEEDLVILALTALANVAMLTKSHKCFSQLLVKRCLLRALETFDSPKARFHAVRALVYLGHQDFPGLYLFDLLEACEDETIYGDNFTEGEALGIVRGITLEKLVRTISSQKDNSWAGLALSPRTPDISLSSPNYRGTGQAHLVPDNKIVDFVLATCRSFVEPPILLRLLIHRFRDPKTLELFESGRKRARRSRVMIDPPILEPYSPLPNHHVYIMRILELWMEKYNQDYRDYPGMRKEVKVLVKPMRRIGGPYGPCEVKLQQLCHDVKKRMSEALDLDADSVRFGEPLHNQLYAKCRDEITTGELPVSLDQAISFAGIQCYIEDVCSSPSLGRRKLSGSSWSLFGDRTLNTKLKHRLPPDVKGKAATKGVRMQQELYMSQRMSDRNAKHLYINRIHELPQYGCKFFSVREVVAPGAKRGVQPKRLLGIGTEKILVLEERSKEIMRSLPLKAMKRWECSEASSFLVLQLAEEQLVFVSDEPGYMRKVNEHIWLCVEELDWMNIGDIDASPWGKTAEERGQWGSAVLVEAARTPAARQRASTVRERSFSKTRENVSPSSSTSSSPPSSSHQTPTVTPRATPTSRTPVESWYDPVIPSRAEVTMPESLDEERPDNSDIAAVVHKKLSEAGVEGMLSGPDVELRDMTLPSLTVTVPEQFSSHPSLSTSEDLIAPYPGGSQSSLLDRIDELQQSSRSVSSVSIEHPHSDSGVGTNSSVSRTTSFPLSETTTASTSSRAHSGSMVSTSSAGGCSSHTEFTKLCDCPPDPDLSPDFDITNFTLTSLLQHPKELARQITLIDHEMLRRVTFSDCLHKVSSVVSKVEPESVAAQRSVEKFAHRFNQLSNWVIESILNQESREQRVAILSQMIQVARQCLHYRNYNAVVAMVVAGLGSSVIRRLKKTWAGLEKDSLDAFLKMEHLVRFKSNYKNYRQYLRATKPPAVPYFGLYLKDLTFIADGNPDCLRGGLINLTKRRQIFAVLSELHTFQSSKYNLRPVHPIVEYLLSHQLTPDIELHKKSLSLEAKTRARKGSSAGVSLK